MTGDIGLDGTTLIVTGASRGIGYAIAEAAAEAGAWVGMVARGRERLDRAAETVGGFPLVADVSNPDEVRALAAHVIDRLSGPPAILVNAAGAFGLAPFAETEPEAFDAQLGVNLRAPFLVTRAFLPGMLGRRSGHIVNIGSVAGRVPLAGNAAYGASKFGLHGLHEILAAELRGTGVRSTLVEPAATDTSLWDDLDPDARDDLPSRSDMLRAADVARVVLFALTRPADVEIAHVAVRSL